MREEIVLSGIVLESSARAAKVRVPRLSDGEDCGGDCRGCALCASRAAPPPDVTAAIDPSAVPPRPGDRVGVAYRPPRRGAMAALFFLPPLLGLMAGLAAAPADGDGAAALWAVIGTLAGFAIAAGLIRAFSGAMGARARVVVPERTEERG